MNVKLYENVVIGNFLYGPDVVIGDQVNPAIFPDRHPCYIKHRRIPRWEMR
ncbi:hypothetical protein LU604_04635 [Erwinia tracheiphila]|uniref:hypothetical protein n=1 Tax=Erwinia tracheiphila TaxID=65700 RepID=UPI001F3D8DF1|nr:hypothetical protein [Erwinia tracheiphila]UIA84320.1 hypothetical protein LU604_04635 [Erwinia tracheiphila]